MAKKVEKKKKTIKEIMANIIDEESLNKRKKEIIEKNDEKIIELNENRSKVEIIEDKKWWELPMEKEKFKCKSHEGKYYAQYEGWNKNLWIGPYETKKDLNNVIKSYIEETKKNVLERNIQNIHSILLDM